jgi:hypothetical protein
VDSWVSETAGRDHLSSGVGLSKGNELCQGSALGGVRG